MNIFTFDKIDHLVLRIRFEVLVKYIKPKYKKKKFN